MVALLAAVYGGITRDVLLRFGVEIDFVDITDLDEVAVVRPTTRILDAETIANPTTAVADLAAWAPSRTTR